MKLGCIVSVLLGCVVSAELVLADQHLPAPPDDPVTVGVMTPAAKSELDACVVRAGQALGDDQQRRVMVGVFIGATGRAESLAILDSSGLELLDKRILRCLSRVNYIPAAPNKGLIQWIFITSLQRKRVTAEDSYTLLFHGGQRQCS
jgi:TonB family protein